MRILYLIGNGFDLNVGLHTSYNEFLKYYLQQPIPESVGLVGQRYIRRLKEDIMNNIDLWSDLELRYGQHLSKLGKMGSSVHSLEEELDIINDDIREKLSNYIAEEDKRSFFEDRARGKFLANIIKPELYLRDFEKNDIKNRKIKFWGSTPNVIDFITFNYTKTIEHLIGNNSVKASGFDVHEPVHVHGFYDERMILGLNDVSQIDNEKLRNLPYAIDTLIKSEANHSYGVTHTNACDSLIKEAQLICCFGLSFGDTDKLWWNKIYEALKINGNLIVILFIHVNNMPDYSNSGPKLQNLMRQRREFFLSQSGVEKSFKSIVEQRIYISFNTPIFDIKVDNRTFLDRLSINAVPGPSERLIQSLHNINDIKR